ncbi:HNH endonuclease [Enterobacter quasiroggenkampii]|nr:HNH endonuclease [Enterobacter roggenkampii]
MFNVNRILPAPASLAAQRRYDGEDVYIALEQSFYKKCYICETKSPLDINVEHFIPHMGDINKKFDWSNLYLVCSRCNNIKLAKYKNLLDCCNDSVWEKVKLLPGFSPGAKNFFIEAMVHDAATIETADLLNDVYNNDKTINKRFTARSLRSDVVKITHRLTKLMTIYYDENSTDAQRENSIEDIKVMIRRSYQYSAFNRWIIKDDAELDELLSPFMD